METVGREPVRGNKGVVIVYNVKNEPGVKWPVKRTVPKRRPKIR